MMLPGQELTDDQKHILFCCGHHDEAKIVAGAMGSLYNRINASHAWVVRRKLDFRLSAQVYEDTMCNAYRTCHERWIKAGRPRYKPAPAPKERIEQR